MADLVLISDVTALAVFRYSNTMIELVEPVDADSFTYEFLLKNGSGLHHICYSAASLEEVSHWIAADRMIKLRAPVYAPLFDKTVVFAMTRSKCLLEFIF